MKKILFITIGLLVLSCQKETIVPDCTQKEQYAEKLRFDYDYYSQVYTLQPTNANRFNMNKAKENYDKAMVEWKKCNGTYYNQ